MASYALTCSMIAGESPPLRLRKPYGFTRYPAGDALANELGVPDTWHRRLPHVAKPVMAVWRQALLE
jgi:hypothetical protein